MTRAPTVSVIIPTYNRAALLPRALDSVIGQTRSDWEVILVDDGSTDSTEALAVAYANRLGERFVCVRQEHQGASSARNHGIGVCRGRYVAFLDSDDEFLPRKLERQLMLFDLRPELGLVYSDFAYVGYDGVRHDSVFDTQCPIAWRVPTETAAPGLRVCTGSLFDWLIQEYFIATIVGLVRRDVLGDGIRFPEDLSYAEEWLFYLRVARACPAGFVEEPLCLHHHVSGSLARTSKRRNTVGYHALLERIAATFDDLPHPQRTAVKRQLAQSSRQLGYDALRANRNGEAFGHFTRALQYEPRVQTLGDLARAAARRLWQDRRGAAEASSAQTRRVEPIS